MLYWIYPTIYYARWACASWWAATTFIWWTAYEEATVLFYKFY